MQTPKQIVLKAFGAESALQLDAHCHLHWALTDLNAQSVALRTTSTKPSRQLPSLSLLYESKEEEICPHNVPQVALRTTSTKPSQQLPSLSSFSQNKEKETQATNTSFCHPERNERVSVSEVEGPPEDAHGRICPNPTTGKPLKVDAQRKGGTFRRSFDSVFLRKAQKNSAQDDIRVFVNTVTPQEYKNISCMEECDKIKVGLGAHPWYVEECDMELFEEHLPKTRFIGEVGLDFSKKFSEEQKAQQVKCFRKICECLATRSFVAQSAPQDDVGVRLIPIISIHSFNTNGKTHKILKDTGVLDDCIVIYHWFGDGPSELKQAISDNCLFSVNERMLETKKGAALARLIPEEQILFESDMPKRKGDFWSVEDSQQSIISAWQKWTKMVNATSK